MTVEALPARVATPATIGQATAVEQARAEAEVKAAVVVAQQCPRNVAQARQQMIESCEQRELAERAFFRYRRGTSQITGPSIHMARELARCWGNVQYGIAEMRRDDVAGESEMVAFAWDVQTNTRSSNTFIVPHIRDTKNGRQMLTDVRDVYENNANMGARRVREAIFAILPPWYTEQAKAICNATIEKGDGTPLAERVANMIQGYAGLGVAKRQLEDKVGLRAENWTARDVAALTVVWKSLTANETTTADEFPRPDAGEPDSGAASRMASMLGAPEPSGADPAASPAAEPPTTGLTGGGESSAPEPDSPLLNTRSKLAKRMFALMNESGLTDRDDRLAYVASIIGHEVESSAAMTDADAVQVIAALEAVVEQPFPTEEGEPS